MRFIFLDRDGVINKDPGGWTEYNYVTRWEDFHFLPDALEALKMLRDNKIKPILISNQAGVRKGYFSEKELDAVNSMMLKAIEDAGGSIEKTYYCIHRDEDNCSCRKPKSGLLEKAAERYGIDLKNIYFIGDSKADVAAGKMIGCKTILVLSGKSSRAEIEDWGDKPDYIFKDLLGAVKQLVKGEKV